MVPSNLEVELAKLDMKFSPGRDNAHPDLDFVIRYCSPNDVGMEGEGIVVALYRIKPDRDGGVGSVILDDPYPLTQDGLADARSAARLIVQYLYSLPLGTKVVESCTLPRLCTEMDYNNIYRVDISPYRRLFASAVRRFQSMVAQAPNN